MSTKLTTNKQRGLAALTLEDFVAYCRALNLFEMGANKQLLLSELGRHLNLTTDVVGIAIIRHDKKNEPSTPYTVSHWGAYIADRVDQLKAIPTRRWNSTTKCNNFKIASATDANFFAAINGMFSSTLVIAENFWRIEKGTACDAWAEPVLYDLLARPVSINLGDILSSFYELRPSNTPYHVAIHGEWDSDYRNLFGQGLVAEHAVLKDIEIQTRHAQLLFRFSLGNGTAYVLHHVDGAKPPCLMWADSKELDKILAQIKETQQRLGHPLIEANSILVARLRDFSRGAVRPNNGSGLSREEFGND